MTLDDPPWTNDAEAALAEAERRIEENGQGWWYGQRPYVTALDRLPRNLAKLASKTVDISATAISDISGLRSKPDVESLHLNDRVSDISVVGELTRLEHLVAYKVPIGDVSALPRCRSLRTLLLNAQNVADLSPLAELPDLERLELWNYRGQPLWPRANLRQLLILGAPPGSLDLSPLETWSELELLSCDGAAIAGDLPALPSVSNLHLHGCDDYVFRSLSGFSGLQTLFASRGPLTNLTPLAPCTQLETVCVSQTHVSSVEPLLDKELLKDISLDDTAVTEISALSRLPHLRYLRAGGTPVRELSGWNPDTPLRSLSLPKTNVRNLEELSGRNLLTLDIHSTRVSDLSFVAGLPSLRGLIFRETDVADFSPVLAHPTLLADMSGYDYRDRGPLLDFADTPFARSDPALRAISEIADSAARHDALRRHFGFTGQ